MSGPLAGLRLGRDERGALSLDLGAGWNAVRLPLVAVLLLALANVVVLLGFTLPRFRSTAAADTAARAGEQAQATLEPQLRRARANYGGVLEAEDDLRHLRGRIGGASGTVSEIVSTIRAAVDAAGLDAARIGYGVQPLSELGLTQMQIDLPVEGTYRQLRRFLDEVLDGPMFVVLERVAASTPGAAARGGRLQMAVTASVFVADGLAAPTAEAPAAPDTGDPVALANRLAQRLQALPALALPADSFELRDDQLGRPPVPAAPSRRNLFEFRGAPSPPVRPVVIDDQDDTFVPEPQMPYELIGVTHTAAGPLATLSDGDQVHLVRGGELLPDGFRVAAVGRISVDLEAGGTTTRLSLRKRDED